jgi:hypothetical protein
MHCSPAEPYRYPRKLGIWGWLNVLTQVVPASPRATATLDLTRSINRTNTNTNNG